MPLHSFSDPVAKKVPDYQELLQTYEQLEESAKIIVRTDLELQKAKTDLDNQVAKLLLLNKLTNLIHRTRESKKILKTVCQSLVTDLGFDRAWTWYQEEGASTTLLIEYGAVPAERPRLVWLAEHGLALLREDPQRILFNIDDSHQDAEIRGLLDAIRVSEMTQVPLRIGDKDRGGVFAARQHAYPPLNKGDLSFFALLGQQVSLALENAEMHSKVAEANVLLEDRVALRTQELAEANTRLRELDRIKSNFISLVSHELRTPMTAIKGFAALLLDFGKHLTEERRLGYLQKINDETDRLSRLIEDLLNISRIESGRITLRWEEIRLDALVRQLFEKIGIQDQPVRFVFEMAKALPRFVADRDKLEQVILNLVANAVRFTPSGGTVTVRADRTNEGVLIRVANPGEGISASELTKIFEKFYRIENDVNRRNPGTGLGLSICRGLVEMHGGKIWAESEMHQETRFFVQLPLNLDKLKTESEQSVKPLGGI